MKISLIETKIEKSKEENITILERYKMDRNEEIAEAHFFIMVGTLMIALWSLSRSVGVFIEIIDIIGGGVTLACYSFSISRLINKPLTKKYKIE